MRHGARRASLRLVVAAAVSAVATGLGACDDDLPPPDRLADGAPARPSSTTFESVEVPTIATESRAVGKAPPACATSSRAIDRVGVAGASRTSVALGARELRACDWTPSSGWCGNAFARLRDAPTDPRLSLTCRDRDGDPLGFLWVVPSRDTSFVVVAGMGYSESYAVVPGIPIRVTSSRVDLGASSATADVSEHALDGRVLRARRIEAQVSG